MSYENIDYVNCHATGTLSGDESEIRAIESVMEVGKKVMVSSFKGNIGHSLCASGVIEAALVINSINNQLIPKMINVDNPISTNHKLLTYDYNGQINNTLKMCSGFGGLNYALIISKYNKG